MTVITAPLPSPGLRFISRAQACFEFPGITAAMFAPLETWWREAKMWTLMYRGGLLAGALGVVAFVGWQVAASRRERRRLEALVASRTRQLRQGEELFRSIFEHATEGIFQSSLDGQNLRANQAMAQLCGYADPGQMQRELANVAHQFYVNPARRHEINAAVARDGAAVGWESEIRRRDGSTIWVSESVRTVIDPASGQTIYQGSIVDVTARREMQAAQERARLAAEAANAAKSAFLTQVTHELRTPLTGILGNARVALRDDSLNDAHRSRFCTDRQQRRTSPDPHRRNPRPLAHRGGTHGAASQAVFPGRIAPHAWPKAFTRERRKNGWSFVASWTPGCRVWSAVIRCDCGRFWTICSATPSNSRCTGA